MLQEKHQMFWTLIGRARKLIVVAVSLDWATQEKIIYAWDSKKTRYMEDYII